MAVMASLCEIIILVGYVQNERYELLTVWLVKNWEKDKLSAMDVWDINFTTD